MIKKVIRTICKRVTATLCKRKITLFKVDCEMYICKILGRKVSKPPPCTDLLDKWAGAKLDVWRL